MTCAKIVKLTAPDKAAVGETVTVQVEVKNQTTEVGEYDVKTKKPGFEDLNLKIQVPKPGRP